MTCDHCNRPARFTVKTRSGATLRLCGYCTAIKGMLS